MSIFSERLQIPTYPPEEWSVFDKTHYIRTNNACEGFNSRYFSMRSASMHSLSGQFYQINVFDSKILHFYNKWKSSKLSLE